MSNTEEQLSDCGCCEGVHRLTPAAIENLPGLSALAYRVGTHGSFKTTMQAALSGQAPLRELTTREDDDPAIATLDGWATILDVLSFYQERIANEGYLRTATERSSILELARSIGYELRPGVAAGTFLAFTLETARGAPLTARIPIGTKAQSTPAQDETPQTFETVEEIQGYAAWNQLRPQQTELVLPKLGLKTIYLKGTATNLRAGDTLLIIGDERAKGAGKESNENWDFRRVSNAVAVASIDPDESYTVVTLNQGLGSFIPLVNPAQKNPRIYALRQRASIFGYNAAEWKALPDVTKASYLGVSNPANLTAEQKAQWPNYTIYVADATVFAARPRFMLRDVEPEPQTVFDAAKAAADQAANKLSDDTGPAVWNAAQGGISAINSVLHSLATAVSKYDSTGDLSDQPFLDATRYLAEALGKLVVIPGNPDLGDIPDALKKITKVPPKRDDIADGLGTLIAAMPKLAAYLKQSPLDLSWDNVKKIIENLNKVLQFVDPVRRSLTALVTADINATLAATSGAVSAAEFAAGKLAGAIVAREAAAFITFMMKAALTLPLPPSTTRLEHVVAVGHQTAEFAVNLAKNENEAAFVVGALAYPELLPIALSLYAAGKLTQKDQTQAATQVRDAVIAAIDKAKTPTSIEEQEEPEKPVFGLPGAKAAPSDTRFVDLDTLYPRIVSGRGWLVLSSPKYQEVYSIESAVEAGRAEFAISSKTTRVEIKGENFDRFEDGVRSVNVYADNDPLEFAARPLTTPVAGGEIALNTKVAGLVSGQLIAITGHDSNTGESIAEVATIDRVDAQGALTKLFLKAALANSYERSTAFINANVSRATHGDSKTEVLGSGDGSAEFQKFQLKQKPLTFVSAATASGAATTLEVRVNDILWHEEPNLYQLPPTERAFITRIADDGKVTVQFGDGVTGARVPTGSENVTANYRVGIGSPGMLAANQLNLLMSRPLGLKDVTNPLAPTGAEDPELLDQARLNGPLTVLTLDRIVSIQDFEDFSRAFAGLGKTQATWLWDGEKRLIHLTVAAVDGGAIPTSSDLYRNLTTAINSSRHVDQNVRIDSYQSLLFDLEAKLLIDPDYLFNDVQTAVEQALTGAFSFNNRSFGQAVTGSEIIAACQAVAGVVAVDLDKLYLNGKSAVPHDLLPANIARWEANQIKPAELLTVNPSGIKLTEMK